MNITERLHAMALGNRRPSTPTDTSMSGAPLRVLEVRRPRRPGRDPGACSFPERQTHDGAPALTADRTGKDGQAAPGRAAALWGLRFSSISNQVQPKDTLVLAQIQAAFPTTEILADDAFQSWGQTYLDGKEYRTALKGKSWDQLDQAYIALRADALGFLSTRALVDVMPAYLTALIELGTISDVPGMLTLILAPPDPETNNGLGKERFGELAEAMTGPQRAAVAVALLRFSERYPETLVGDAARAAFDRHWKAYLPGGGA